MGGEYERGVEPPAHLRGVRGTSPGNFSKIYVSENAFQAILKPIFPYSITSILSEVRNSNTLFLTIILNFLNCHSRGVWGTSPAIFFLKKIYVSENAFQAILKPIFPYSITSILSEVRNSNTLFLTIILHFLVIRGGYGGPPPDFFLKKIYVSENAFQAILKPIFSIFYNLNFK